MNSETASKPNSSSSFAPRLIISSRDESQPISILSAHLMPFNLNHDGKAKVNDYLILKKESTATESSTESDPVSNSHFSSSFRGRRIESTRLNLPEGHSGFLFTLPLKSLPKTHINSVVEQSKKSKKLKSDYIENGSGDGDGNGNGNGNENGEGEESGLRRSPRKKSFPTKFPSAIPVKKQIQKFSMDSDSEDEDDKDEEKEQQTEEKEKPEDVEMDQDLEPSMEQDQDQDVTGNEDQELKEEDKRVLTPWATFGKDFLVWGADGQLDLGDDPFHKSLNEWERISKVVSTRRLFCSRWLQF